MQADTFRWSMDSAGDWLCIQTDKARQVLDTLKEGKGYDVEIKALKNTEDDGDKIRSF